MSVGTCVEVTGQPPESALSYHVTHHVYPETRLRPAQFTARAFTAEPSPLPELCLLHAFGAGCVGVHLSPRPLESQLSWGLRRAWSVCGDSASGEALWGCWEAGAGHGNTRQMKTWSPHDGRRELTPQSFPHINRGSCSASHLKISR